MLKIENQANMYMGAIAGRTEGLKLNMLIEDIADQGVGSRGCDTNNNEDQCYLVIDPEVIEHPVQVIDKNVRFIFSGSI